MEPQFAASLGHDGSLTNRTPLRRARPYRTSPGKPLLPELPVPIHSSRPFFIFICPNLANLFSPHLAAWDTHRHLAQR